MHALVSIAAIVGAGAVGLLVLWVVGLRRAVKGAVTTLGAPTPAEAKIEAQTTKLAGDIAAAGEAKAKEVQSEDRAKLVADARARFFGKR